MGVTINLRDSPRKINLFEEHYNKKASKTWAIGNAIFRLESMIGVLPPWEGKKLYTVLVDPHLIHGCEVSLDRNRASLAKLEEVQVVFLRQLLGLNQHSMLALLFTETSIMPVKFQWITLALGFLKYLMGLTSGQYAHQALNDSIYLAETGRSSWVRDLQLVLLDLPTPLTLPDLRTTTTTAYRYWWHNKSSPRAYG